ncbi:MAG: multiubiquitin domain-containing protein [Terriglobales bacterium]
MEKLHVFVNRKKVEFDDAEVTGEQLLAKAGFPGNQWDLLQLQGKGDPTGGTLIQANQLITLKNGEHFRVIPGNRTFGGL